MKEEIMTAHERVLKQERLKDQKPDDYTSNKEVRRVLDFRLVGDHIVFECDDDGSPNPIPVDELNLDVVEDTLFQLRLSNRAWHWSKAFDAITLKKDKKKYYGKVEYLRPGGTFEEWNGQAPKDFECKTIRFLAALNEDGGDRFHGFSLNIDLKLPGGGTLPITLDPDIQNPKPQVAEENPRPGLLSAQ
jgi:hypothetical protein